MPRVTILYVDDEQPNLDLFQLTFSDDFNVVTVRSAAEALALMDREDVGVVVTDQVMPGMDGVEFLARVFVRHPNSMRIVVTAYQDASLLLGAINAGHVSDYVLKPWEPAALRALLSRAAEQYLRRRALELVIAEREYLADEVRSRYDPQGVVGSTGGLESVMELVRAVAPTSSTVLVTGETGTGKELVARTIHAMSGRRDRTIIKVDCSSLAPSLIESELFGHERGAFTGATSLRRGRFELAQEGTLFLDEIADMPLELQPRLLRVLQDREFERLGSECTIKADARIIAATNADLEQRVDQGAFRRDLYYRLNVVHIELPALRERLDDLEALTAHFLRKHGGWRASRLRVTDRAFARLKAHAWPGNIRELENVVERALLLARGDVLDAEDFALTAAPRGGAQHSLRGRIREQRQEQLHQALVGAGGNIARAARDLGVSRSTLRSQLKRFGLE
jgi:DNA-binding NtrC family response regulator